MLTAQTWSQRGHWQPLTVQLHKHLVQCVLLLIPGSTVPLALLPANGINLINK